MPLFCLSCELPGIANQCLWPSFLLPLPPNQRLRWKNAIFMCTQNHFVLQILNFHFPTVKIPLRYISSPKTQSVYIFCFVYISILMYSSVQSLVLWGQQYTKSNLDLFQSKAQKQDFTRKLRFYFDQMFHECLSIIRINRICCRKLETSSHAAYGLDNQAKIEKK